MTSRAHQRPSWERLYETASAQAGYFTTREAGAAGYSLPLLHKHIKAGRIARIRRGIYRLVHFPASDHEELVIAWLWSERAGVFSHQTALHLHELSDTLPAKTHLTLPASWRARRLRAPHGVLLHHADLADHDRTWFGPVPVTTARRTLVDAAHDHLAPDQLALATRQARARGLISPSDLAALRRTQRATRSDGLP